jgi:hypothetical protein
MPPWTFPPWLGATLLLIGAVIIALLGWLVYKAWKQRKRLEAVIVEMREDREVNMGILKTIKGWTIVNVETNKARVDEVAKLIAPMPEIAAQKVMEKLEEQRQNGGKSPESSG